MNKLISDLVAQTSPSLSDVIAIFSGTSTKKLTLDSLKGFISIVGVGATAPSPTDKKLWLDGETLKVYKAGTTSWEEVADGGTAASDHYEEGGSAPATARIWWDTSSLKLRYKDGGGTWNTLTTEGETHSATGTSEPTLSTVKTWVDTSGSTPVLKVKNGATWANPFSINIEDELPPTPGDAEAGSTLLLTKDTDSGVVSWTQYS